MSVEVLDRARGETAIGPSSEQRATDSLHASLETLMLRASEARCGGPHTQLSVTTGWLRTVVGADRLVARWEAARWRLPGGSAGAPSTGTMIYCCRDLLAEDGWPDLSHAASEIGVRSLLTCHVRVSQHSLVTLTCAHPEAGRFGHDELLALVPIAVQAAAVVSQAERRKRSGPVGQSATD